MADYFSLQNGRIIQSPNFPQTNGIGFLSFTEADSVNYERISGALVNNIKKTKFTSFEKKEDFQYLVLNTPNCQNQNLYEKIVIFMDMRGVLVFSDSKMPLSGLVEDFADKLGGDSMSFFLSALLSALISHDYVYLEGVEKDLGKIETEILSEHTPNYPEKINRYRRKVAVIKRYYEQLYEATYSLSKQDFLMEAKQEFQEINSKVERLREEALYLRDYMSQVREAYQQALDTSLNSVMKFLAAATLVFSPLQFLVGWFGMNFIMPETEIPIGYLIPFVLSVIIVVVTIYIFKRKKWF